MCGGGVIIWPVVTYRLTYRTVGLGLDLTQTTSFSLTDTQEEKRESFCVIEGKETCIHVEKAFFCLSLCVGFLGLSSDARQN